jgi:hypothetical protein
MGNLIKTYSTKQRPVNNNSTVTDKLDCGGAVQEALHAARLEAYPSLELGRFTSRITLKMGRYVPLKRRFLLEPHGIVSQWAFVTNVRMFVCACVSRVRH